MTDFSQAAKLLLQHPDVTAVAIMSEQTADGINVEVAYVVADPVRTDQAKKQILEQEKRKRVAQWRTSFNLAYRSSAEGWTPSFAGWRSSYTNQPIPIAEMEEWLQQTADRILSLRPKAVMEVGCGVGLLVEAIAPHCETFIGSDISPQAIASLRAFTQSKPDFQHVVLREGDALSMADQASHSVDTVIINSVIQYFPDAEYLRAVLTEAVRITKPGGRVFVGDVRHFGLLPIFHTAVQLAKAPSSAKVRWLRSAIALAVQQERELAVDPSFFHDLANHHSEIQGVETLLRRGTAQNELTRYRYDAILHIGASAPQPAIQLKAVELQVQSPAEISAILNADPSKPIVLRGVPNERLAGDIASMKSVISADDDQTVELVRASVPQRTSGFDPQDFWVLGDVVGCDVKISWSKDDRDGSFDVAMLPAASLFRLSHFGSSTIESRLGRTSTDPMEAAFRQRLGVDLLRQLREVVSGTDLPHSVIIVDELPGAPHERTM